MSERQKMSRSLMSDILLRDNYTCQYCGTRRGPFHIDHVYPVSRGGQDIPENLVTSCAKCNTQKGAKIGVWPLSTGVKRKAESWHFIAFAFFFLVGFVILSASYFLGNMRSEYVFISILSLLTSIVALFSGARDAEK
jgi:hypothetical protein